MTIRAAEGDDPPFGAFSPNRAQMRALSLTQGLPYTYFGRKAASLLLGATGGRQQRPYDVAVFGGMRARLHPFDNLCEKRVFATPRHWEPMERAALAEAIRTGPDGFVFVDVGANAGLYTLFAYGTAQRLGKRISALCIEPDAEMRRRMTFNFRASRLDPPPFISAFAVSDRPGAVPFHIDAQSRGRSRLAEQGATMMNAAPLLQLVQQAELTRMDALKIDIEGAEKEVLRAFFSTAEETLFPSLLITETLHEQGTAEHLKAFGYEVALRTRLNAILIRGS